MLVRPAATDRVATREEGFAGHAVITALARHHNLLERQVDLGGSIYVRSGWFGFGPLWQFATGVAHALGLWVNVSPDQTRRFAQRRDRL